MRFIFPSRFVMAVTAVALAVTTFTAAPAQAQEDYRAGQAIATILGLAVVGALINDHRKDKKRDERYRAPVRNQAHGNANRFQPKALPQLVDRKLLPQQCLRSFQTRNGPTRMFAQRCLERTYRAVNRLPQNCAIRVRTDRGPQFGYEARCLRRNGYRLARG